MARNYSSTASEATLTAGIDGSATTMLVSGATGYPSSTPFTAVLDPDTSSEEIVTVTNRAGSSWTIARAQDGSVALPHSTGAKIRHMMTARDLREPQEHIDATSGVHGLTSGNVVGTSQAQTLTNKTISGTANTLTNIAQSSVVGLTALQAGFDSHEADTTVHGATGAVVGTTNTQTLTNKTINRSSNTITVNHADISDRYFYVAELASDSSVAASSGIVAPGTMSTVWARGSWDTDGHSSRRVVPASGMYRVYFRTTWAGSAEVTGRPLTARIYNAPADGSSLGTLLATKTLGNFNTATTVDIEAVENFTAGRVVVVRVENGYPTSSWTLLGGRSFTQVSVEYLGLAT